MGKRKSPEEIKRRLFMGVKLCNCIDRNTRLFFFII